MNYAILLTSIKNAKLMFSPADSPAFYPQS